MTKPQRHTFTSQSPEATLAFGRRLGALARPGDVVCLSGPLGAGKTLLTKGIAAGAGVADARIVTSPTFTLINEYEGRLPVAHVDAYRVSGAGELIDIGIEEYFYGGGLCIIEWSERVAACLPAERLDVLLAHCGPTCRRLTWTGRGERHAALAEKIAACGRRQERRTIPGV